MRVVKSCVVANYVDVIKKVYHIFKTSIEVGLVSFTKSIKSTVRIAV